MSLTFGSKHLDVGAKMAREEKMPSGAGERRAEADQWQRWTNRKARRKEEALGIIGVVDMSL